MEDKDKPQKSMMAITKKNGEISKGRSDFFKLLIEQTFNEIEIKLQIILWIYKDHN